MTRKLLSRPLLVMLLAGSANAAADTNPEIERPVAPPQAAGEVHTLRTIPEACARIEGVFTGDTAEPYRFAVVQTHPNCQPRARLVDAAQTRLDPVAGWLFNDLIRIPSAACPTQHAVLRIWRKPGTASPPVLDAQGRARIYLQDAKAAAKAGNATQSLPVFAAAMGVEGEACN